MPDMVNHPPHYKSLFWPYECIEYTRLMTFDAGNMFKYVYRYPEKHGLEDLEKAMWYAKDIATNWISSGTNVLHTPKRDADKFNEMLAQAKLAFSGWLQPTERDLKDLNSTQGAMVLFITGLQFNRVVYCVEAIQNLIDYEKAA